MFIRTKSLATLFLCLFVVGLSVAQGQAPQQHPALYFISDCQVPLLFEKIIRKTHHNSDARDSLFREIENKNDGYVFMLGDLVGKGSKNSQWKGIDSFLETLRGSGTKVYGIPGNHEFLFRATHGINNFKKRFPDLSLTGYCVHTDSMAIVMLNSNFGRLSRAARKNQQLWYLAVMDSLDSDATVQTVIVCTHHSPFSNSTVVGSSVKVQQAFIPRFESSPKTKLFITGHSHNLECFDGTRSKRFLVIGGGGGIDQPLYTGEKEKYKDLIRQDTKPRFFYLMVYRNVNVLEVTISGFSKELSPVSEIKLSL
jgi:UDP-2,3-diacylglucosamine pyrophosphatase LpxH